VADIFREVDEDVRKEHYHKLWKKYGLYVIALAVLIVVAVGGWEAWKVYSLKQRQAASRDYALAVGVIAEGPSDAALAALQPLAKPGEGGYGLLATFQAARVMAERGDTDAAAVLWGQIADSTAADPGMRAVATLLMVQHRLGSADGAKADGAELDAALAPLLAPGQAFRPAALELSALVALHGGDTARARTALEDLADDVTAPQGARTRATQLLAGLPEQ